MFELIYENSIGERISFGGKKSNYIRFGETDLFDIDLDYESTGGVITSFDPGIRDCKLEVFSMGSSLDERNRFVDIISYDTRLAIPGRIYCGSSHIEGYFRAVPWEDWYQTEDMFAAECTFVSDNPRWIREVKQTLLTSDELEIGGRNYPDNYKRNYLYSSGASTTLTNPFRLPCKCDIVFSGPCSDPYVIIAGNRYQVKGSYQKGQLVIVKGFGKEKDILLRGQTGATRSIFNEGVRTREDHIFAEIPIGDNIASWAGAFNIEITMYEERLTPYFEKEMFDRG